MEDLTGRQLGAYQIVQGIGESISFVVYKGHQASLDRFVAVKVIKPEFAASATFLEGVRRAVMAAVRLSHPHILRLHDMQSADGLHYIVTDYAEGGSLQERLAKGPLSPPEASTLGAEIAEALGYAHQRGVIHGGLTPENILLDAGGHALTSDFGLARVISASRPDVQAATPEYMAPEQAQSLPVDARTDIYSLGIILYQALTGYVPFRGETALSTLYKQVNQQPPSLSFAGLEAPQLQEVLDKALAKSPDARFQSGAAVAAALRAAQLPPTLPSEAPTAPPARQTFSEAETIVSARAAPPWQPPPPPPPQPPREQERFERLPSSGGPVRAPIGGSEPQRETPWGLLAGAATVALLVVVVLTVVAIGIIRRSRSAQAGTATPASVVVGVTATRTPLLPTATSTAIVVVFDTPTPTPVESPTSIPSTPSTTPTATATATPTDTPTATVVPTDTSTATPTSTDTPAATPTITSTSTVTATPTGTPTPTPPPVLATGHIAYPLNNPQTGLTDVWVASADGADQHPVAACMRQPDFRGDGRLVMNGEGCGTDSIWAINLDGSEKRELTLHPEDSHPTWSPDGGFIVYSSTQQGDGQPRLYAQSIQDKPQAPPFIVFGGTGLIGILPVWLPGGEIAYNGCDYGFGSGGNCGIWVVRPDGSQLRSLTNNSSDRGVDAYGGNVVFMSTRDGNWEVYRVSADGSGLTRLTDNGANDGLPTWSPDGQYIAFASDRDGQWAIWAMRPDGSSQQKLFNLNGSLGPRWAEERVTWGP